MAATVSVGAIGAAFVAALVSLLSLIISKENKVSEFRQIWIDSLRNEITSYLRSINAIFDALQIQYEDQNEKIATLGPLYSELNSANFMISLRLNPKEKPAKEILRCMSEFQKLFADDENVSLARLRKIENDLLVQSKDLLKIEWKRVKRGEITFIISKFAALIMTGAILFFLISPEALSNTWTPSAATKAETKTPLVHQKPEPNSDSKQ